MKYLFFVFSSCCIALTAQIHSMDSENATIIPQASYLVYEGADGVAGGIPRTSKTVTFYTYDGNSIKTIEHNFSSSHIEALLDPQAPKPQPDSYTITYWPAAAQIGFGVTNGTPGHFILFYDKHHNIIKRFRFNQAETNDFTKFSDQCAQSLDLQKLWVDGLRTFYKQAEMQKMAHLNQRNNDGCKLF